jgi:hypothetical protein
VDGGHSRNLSPQQRGSFLFIQAMGTSDTLIHGPSSQRRNAQKGDLESLADEGLLRRDFANSSTPSYEVTPLGRLFHTERMQTAKGPPQRLRPRSIAISRRTTSEGSIAKHTTVGGKRNRGSGQQKTSLNSPRSGMGAVRRSWHSLPASRRKRVSLSRRIRPRLSIGSGRFSRRYRPGQTTSQKRCSPIGVR